jgi:hypothetical protein
LGWQSWSAGSAPCSSNRRSSSSSSSSDWRALLACARLPLSTHLPTGEKLPRAAAVMPSMRMPGVGDGACTRGALAAALSGLRLLTGEALAGAGLMLGILLLATGRGEGERTLGAARADTGGTPYAGSTEPSDILTDAGTGPVTGVKISQARLSGGTLLGSAGAGPRWSGHKRDASVSTTLMACGQGTISVRVLGEEQGRSSKQGGHLP